MKKIFTLLCVALCATSFFANVVTGTCGDNLQWAYDTDTHALTITGWGDMYWSDERPWEQVAGEITSVALPDGLTSIGDGAFYECSSLTSITIPNSVTTVGGGMFYGCSKLKSVVLSNNITSLPSYNDFLGTYGFFENCSALTSITIPNSVTSIEYEAFYECSSLTSVTIPNSVTSIESSAFERCYNLTSVTIGNSVTSIGDDVFYDCSSLSSVTIPNSVTSIGYHAFYNCSSLTSVTIGNSVRSIGSSAFASCTSLTFITIPNSVTSIGNYAFSSCSQVIMQGTTPPSIAANTFNDNATIFVPCSAMDAYLAAPVWQFLDLHGLNYNVTLNATEGGSAQITAADCESNSITIEAVVRPYNCEFYPYHYKFSRWSDGNTDNPRTVTLTKDVTLTAEFEESKYYTVKIYGESLSGSYEREEYCSTYWYSFYGSVELTMREGTSITFSDAYVGECGNWTGWSDGVTERERTIVITSDTTIYSIIEYPTIYTVNISGDRICGYYSGYCGGSHWEEYYGTSSVQLFVNEGTSITVREESSCGTWLGWSDGVTEKERTIFINSDTTISSHFDVETYSVSITAGEGGYLENGNIELEFNECNRDWIYTCAYAYDGYYFVGWSDGNTDQCINIYPETDINLVAQFAPKQQVTVLLGVDNASKGMGSVSGSGIYYSGDYVTITATPNAGYHFLEWSDGNGDATRELYLQSDTTLFATFAPGEYGGKCGDNLTWQFQPEERKLVIEGEGNMYDYQFGGYGWWGNEDKGEVPWSHLSSDIKTILLPEGMTSIGDGAFSWCIALKTISIPNSVKTIGYAAFTSCDSLTFINFGTNITHIGPVAFAGCSAITILNIPNSVTSIGADAFLYCSSLTSVAIPNSVTSIGGGAFSGCSSLTSVTIPNSVTSIGGRAFSECSSLTSVTIGNSVTSIGDWAFYNCEKLGTLVLGDKVKEIGEEAFNGCNKLYHIYCYAPEPPMAYESSFANYNVNLYVPCNYLNNYKYDRVFGSFRYIQCIESEDVTTDDVVVTPGTNDVTITWPTEGNADTYTIVIKKDGEVVCTLTFNAEGQLLNIAFAPGRDSNHPAQYAEAVANGKGFRFTVTGLEEGTDYTYDIIVKDSSNKTINSYSGKFTTEPYSAVDNTYSQSSKTNCQKLLRNGQLIILRDGVEYNAMGAEIR